MFLDILINGIIESVIGKSAAAENLFLGPKAIAIDHDTAFVADSLLHRIYALSIKGVFKYSIGSVRGSDVGSFNYPIGVAVYQNILIVTDFENSRVQIFDKITGHFLRKFGDGILAQPAGVAVDPADGNIYVVDMNNHRICVFNVDGKFLKSWGKRGSVEPAAFNMAYSVSLNEHYVFVADTSNDRIQIFTKEGEFVRAFPEEGSDIVFSRPTHALPVVLIIVFLFFYASPLLLIFLDWQSALRG